MAKKMRGKKKMGGGKGSMETPYTPFMGRGKKRGGKRRK